MSESPDVLYERLFHQMYAKLYFYAKKFVEEEDARDIVEDVFVDVWRKKDSIEFGSQIQSLLYCATYHKCINFLKRQKISMSHLMLIEEVNSLRIEAMEDNRHTPQHELEMGDLHRQIHQAIDELPEKCREVFKLSYLHDMKNAEIASVLGLSVRTVEAHMYHALKYLRKRLSGIALLFLTFLYTSYCSF